MSIRSVMMPHKVCQPTPSPPKKRTKEKEGKEKMTNSVAVLMMKVCVLLFGCYDILMILFVH